ncbi:unnamed protein product [Rotaria magnacalcarata]|uniref:Uncharacterized protein n=1 Tax=Rotaria magnacalcarata TaxID=392030 RepID=A0A816RVA9_9BILA|nr:unnamed protein product [Rotaria magnacalcarata]CAF1426667.1 unnamed protein product [Rotaria magnacalcarata]CAF2054320.1 unnamed protein product [Rotaria magnacalcarata]CAF2075913.1 unnamed protein product [Rotaria magnacalcarata]CAF3758213.1 unnamed protein product [Rotaria magnacalcarata]
MNTSIVLNQSTTLIDLLVVSHILSVSSPSLFIQQQSPSEDILLESFSAGDLLNENLNLKLDKCSGRSIRLLMLSISRCLTVFGIIEQKYSISIDENIPCHRLNISIELTFDMLRNLKILLSLN